MSDVNHQISKTLVQKYGKDTLFVLEDLTGVSFEESNLSRTAKRSYEYSASWYNVDFWRQPSSIRKNTNCLGVNSLAKRALSTAR